MSKYVSTLLILAITFLQLANGISISAANNIGWSIYPTPADGEISGWQLADGSDVSCVAEGLNGILYAGVNGLDKTLYYSSDNGYSWQAFDREDDDIHTIITSPSEEGVFYYCTDKRIAKTVDDGENFKYLPQLPEITDNQDLKITSIDVLWADEEVFTLASLADSRTGEFGGLYVINDSALFAEWVDLGIGGYDVYGAAFSPSFMSDEQIIAVVSDEASTLVTTKIGNKGWGNVIANASFKTEQDEDIIPSSPVKIRFPADYCVGSGADDLCNTVFVSMDTGIGKGGVHQAFGSLLSGKYTTQDLGLGFDVSALSTSGGINGLTIWAGEAAGSAVYSSSDMGKSWQKSIKSPSGEACNGIFISESGSLYAATAGFESGVSVSTDGGCAWNQLSFIDSTITHVRDMVISPSFKEDGTIFLLTLGRSQGVWRTCDEGLSWQRVFSSSLSEADLIDRIAISPSSEGENGTIYLTGYSEFEAVVWQSENSGETFNRTRPPVDTIDAFYALSDDTFLICGYDGAHSFLYVTENSGLSYRETEAGELPVSDIQVFSERGEGGVILLSDISGNLYYSIDFGVSFSCMQSEGLLPSLGADPVIAKGSCKNESCTFYAVDNNNAEKVYRLKIGEDNVWSVLSTSLPQDTLFGHLGASGEGLLYGVNASAASGGEELCRLYRCLNPSSSMTLEGVPGQAAEGAFPYGLWTHGNTVFMADKNNANLYVYHDAFTSPVVLKSPEDSEMCAGSVHDDVVRGVELEWERTENADKYEWQVDTGNGFSGLTEEFTGYSTDEDIKLGDLLPSSTYRWRVRVVSPVRSPWSEVFTFNTPIGSFITAPELKYPAAGASVSSSNPVLQWSAMLDAKAYELQVSDDFEFKNLVINRTGESAICGTAWQVDTVLESGRAFFWKVRAAGEASLSEWSEVGAFTTAKEEVIPVAEPPLPSVNPPSPPQYAEVMPAWAVQVIIVLAVFIAILLMAILAVLMTKKRIL